MWGYSHQNGCFQIISLFENKTRKKKFKIAHSSASKQTQCNCFSQSNSALKWKEKNEVKMLLETDQPGLTKEPADACRASSAPSINLYLISSLQILSSSKFSRLWLFISILNSSSLFHGLFENSRNIKTFHFFFFLAEQAAHCTSKGLGRRNPWNASWSGSSWYCSTQSLRDVVRSNGDGKPHAGNLPVPGAHKSQKLKECILNGWPATPEALPSPVGFS